jgi:TldD protein
VVSLDLVTDLMGKAEGRCAYAEARHVESRDEALSVRAGQVDDFAAGESDGIGVRVRVGGGWGFAATRDVSAAGAEAALARALAIAEAQPAGPPAPLAPVPPSIGHWASPHAVDPFDIALEEKLELLFAAEAALRAGGGDERIARSVAAVRAWRERKAFASTEGAACTQELVATGAGIGVWASDDRELQVRSYPLSHGGLFAAAGWEHVLALDLAGHAPRVAAEAIELLTAPECPEGITTIVLDGEQLALQVHESVGHALELDRILLDEASYAGTSWVRAEDIGSARFGSEQMTITADATLPARSARSGGTTRASRRPATRSSTAACCAPRCPTASPRRRSASTARAAAPGPTASRASRSCG